MGGVEPFSGHRRLRSLRNLELPPLPVPPPSSFLEVGAAPKLSPPVKAGDSPLFGPVRMSSEHFPSPKNSKPQPESQQLGPDSWPVSSDVAPATMVPPKGTPAPTQIPPMPDRGSVMQAVITGTATWDGGKPLKGWEMRFFYNTQDRSMWGCNRNDAGGEVETMEKCVVKGPQSRFQADGTLTVDIVVQGTGQVNRYVGKIAPCPGGEESCPGKERKFSGKIETMVAGMLPDKSVVGTPGLKGKVEGVLKDVEAEKITDY